MTAHKRINKYQLIKLVLSGKGLGCSNVASNLYAIRTFLEVLLLIFVVQTFQKLLIMWMITVCFIWTERCLLNSSMSC